MHEAERLDPSGVGGWLRRFGTAYYSNLDYHNSIQWFERVPNLGVREHAYLAAAYAQLGDTKLAEEHAERINELNDEFTVTEYVASLAYVNDGDRNHLAEGLRKAGLPE